jgi:hypothetical protein
MKNIGLSFHTAKDLRNRAEILPLGPSWKSKLWPTLVPTKQTLFLYYRDPIDCLQSILHNPLFQDYIQFDPFQLFWSAEGAMRVYTEWLSGNAAWEMQVCNLISCFDKKANYLIYQRILFHKGQHSLELFYHRIKQTYLP